MVLFFFVHLIDVWVWQEFANQRVNLAVESCREEQLLRVTNGAKNAAHWLDEAEVAHVVGLVNYNCLDGT